MTIPQDKIQTIWHTFTGVLLTSAEVARISSEVGNYNDLLAKILFDTDFLEKYPSVERILRSKAQRVARTLLDEPAEALKKTYRMQRQQLQVELFEKQKQYTIRMKDLVELEQEIFQIRNSLSSY